MGRTGNLDPHVLAQTPRPSAGLAAFSALRILPAALGEMAWIS